MSDPTEHKTVQARILAYAQEIGWTLVSRAEAEQRRGKEPGLSSPGSGGGEDTGWNTGAPLEDGDTGWKTRAPLGDGEDTGWKTRAPLSLYFGHLLHGQLRAFNPLYQEAEGASIGQWQRLPSNIAGNRDFLTILRSMIVFCSPPFRI